MTSRVIAFLVVVVLLILGGVYLIKQNVGNLWPAFGPVNDNLTQVIENQEIKPTSGDINDIPVGDKVDIPLKLDDKLKIGLFAKGLGNARDLEFSPEGTLLLSIPASGKVVALADKNNDGKADEVKDVLTGLNKPHGLTFNNGKLFVSELNKVSRFNFDENSLNASLDKKLFDMPYSGGHSTRSIVFTKDGKMLVSIGSSCNVCVEPHPWLATVISSDFDGNNPQVYSKGLRNAVFLTLNQENGEVWVTEMGRDLLGDNLPSDEINILKENGSPSTSSGPSDFGWPYCYEDRTHDNNFDPKNEHSCEQTELPTFKIQAHSAPLGLTFIKSPQFPAEWQGDLLVSYHGSWNRSTPTGYKVVRINIENGKAIGQEDFLTGFLEGSQASGRPVDLIFDKSGSLYISDDKSGNVYKVSKK